ncbi:replication initiation protein RepM [Acinetobacter pollinis]|uniref:replication initiation protein RepM n=1 Tax=Acinetobacter pollinis TaxID=2605270 RepID=UPI0018A26461|nr:replication initiation protein RepM [Acinetobacter pollinis]MBF7699065.1 replication initiation protein [Acinetobacter pollinis]
MKLIVKSNALIEASYKFDQCEQRLVLLAINTAREQKKIITESTPITIFASDYAKMFNTTRQASYLALKNAVESLFFRYVTIYDFNESGQELKKIHTRWVQDIAYFEDKGYVELTFARLIIPFISRLESRFTSYDMCQTAKLSSKYATRLYELISQWRSVGSFNMSIADFREKMGLDENEYKAISHLKKNVLDLAVLQINTHTDIKISYEQYKKGRVISDFSFKFKQKKQYKKEIKDVKRDQNTPDLFVKMTDKQRHFFASKLSEMPEMSRYSKGTESYQQFASRIADMLLEPEQFKQLYPILEKAGF